jgi:hypothetical protein
MEMKHKRPPIDVVPTRRYFIFLGEVQNFIFSNQMILSPLHGVLHIQSACDSVAPFFSFIGYPVCSNKHFQIIVTIKKRKGKKETFANETEKKQKKVLTLGEGSG